MLGCNVDDINVDSKQKPVEPSVLPQPPIQPLPQLKVQEPSNQPANEPTGRPAPEDRIPRISIDELKQKMDSGADILMVDTRHQEEYIVEHIKGAVFASLDMITEGKWLPPPAKALALY